MLLSALTAGLLLFADTTPQPAAAAPTSITAAVDKKPVLKCQKMQVLGSRMPVRVCRTEAQIKQTEQDARDMTQDFQKINPERLQ